MSDRRSDTLETTPMIPHRFPATLVDFISLSMRMLTDNGVGNCVISLSGRVDESRLQRTIRLALDAEPILGCRFVDHWRRPYWRRRTDLDELSLCPVVEGTEDSPAFARFLADTIDPTRDPLFQARIFRGETDTICIKGSHAVSDGPGAARFFHSLIDLYRRLKEEPDLIPVPNVAGIRDLKALKRQFGVRERFRVVRELLTVRSAPPSSWLFPDYKEKNAFHGYVILKLPPERGRHLFRYGFERRATMTSVVLAGLYLAALKVFQVASDGVVTFTTTADLRRFLPLRRQEYALANMSGPGRFRMDPRRDRDFEAALASIRDQLKRIMKARTSIPAPVVLFMSLGFLPFSLLGSAMRAQVRRASSRPERRWGLANPGEVDLGFLDLEGLPVRDAYFAGPLMMGGGIALVSSIFRGGLTLSLGLSGRVMEESVARRFLEQVDRELPFHSVTPGHVLTLATDGPSGE